MAENGRRSDLAAVNPAVTMTGAKGGGSPRLSALVVARNEEARLAACLACLGFADEIVVVLEGAPARVVGDEADEHHHGGVALLLPLLGNHEHILFATTDLSQ